MYKFSARPKYLHLYNMELPNLILLFLYKTFTMTSDPCKNFLQETFAEELLRGH